MALVIEDCGAYLKTLIDGDIDLLACHQVNPDRYPFLLESHRYLNEHSRFDILFAFPGDKITTHKVADASFFKSFDDEFRTSFLENNTQDDLPFVGGWFVFLSYELVSAIEKKLAHIMVEASLPLASATRIPVAIIKDHKKQQNWIIFEPGKESLLHVVQNDINRSKKLKQAKPISVTAIVSIEDEFLSGVKKIAQYLKDGDTFQVNLSRQWTTTLTGRTDYIDVYRSLRSSNPSPFAGLACIDNSYICSTSPERLVKSSGRSIEMRPIAGTRPRSLEARVDKALAQELLNNSKEKAEHTMLLDLIRNDLGRICEPGSIHVNEHMQLESYATVHHIVSSISGKISPEKISPIDIIKAVFPGGTITGCPKIRCMEIINELETEPRGAYTGSMGYINRNGDMDLNILIRSVVINGDELSFRTGAGIVADSVAKLELQETLHKAKGVLNALG
ncbi:MAG: aminodeoxychorismate synthase component I [Piscirickettsiaceae bacterium]|nr:MAG: aminodeoxychorismate synthase component I [Piscirickettsiaceae bacterium]